MRDLVYEASDYTAGLPVAVAEIDALLAQDGKPIAKDPRKTIHFLLRVRNTIDAMSQDMAHIRRRVEELTYDRGRRGTPTTLSPADALKFAAPEEIEAVVDRMSRQNLQTLRQMVEQSNATRDELTRMLDQLKYQVETLVAAGTLPSDIGAQILDSLPAELPTVHHQHVLAEGFFSEEDMQWEQANRNQETSTPPVRRPSLKDSDGHPATDAQTRPQDTQQEPPAEDETPLSFGEPISEPRPEVKASQPVFDIDDVPVPEFATPKPEFTAANPFQSPPEPEPGGWADDIDIEETSQPVSVNPLAKIGAEENLPQVELDLASFFPEPVFDAGPGGGLDELLFAESEPAPSDPSLDDLFGDSQ